MSPPSSKKQVKFVTLFLFIISPPLHWLTWSVHEPPKNNSLSLATYKQRSKSWHMQEPLLYKTQTWTLTYVTKEPKEKWRQYLGVRIGSARHLNLITWWAICHLNHLQCYEGSNWEQEGVTIQSVQHHGSSETADSWPIWLCFQNPTHPSTSQGASSNCWFP